MALKEESQNLTAFITPMGLNKQKRLPMGLASVPGGFQKLMELVFSGLSYDVVLIYLDDNSVFGKTFEKQLQRSEKNFHSLAENALKIQGSKCRFS